VANLPVVFGEPGQGDSIEIDPGQNDIIILVPAVCIDEMAHGGR